MTLHNRIMKEADNHNIDTDHGCGYVDGMTRTAQLVSEADELMADMAEALEQAITSMQDSGYQNDSVAVRTGRESIAKYNAYKEQ